jgi:drug/metabolite transporter (DMT)-like permease
MTSADSEETYSPLKVYGALFIGLTAFSLAPILVRFAADYSGVLLATIRTVLAVVILAPIYISYKLKKEVRPVESRKEHILVAIAGLALGLHFIAWINSIYYTSVSSASVLVCIHPIILIIAERTLMKTTFRPIVWTGVIISFIGTLLLGYFDLDASNSFPQAGLGNTLAVTAAVIFALYFLIGRKIRQKRTWIGYVFPVYAYAAITCTIFLVATEGVPSQIDGRLFLIGLALAVGPQIFGHGSLNYAVKYVSATLLSTLILAEPILASIIAYFLFQELPLPLSVIAMLIILVGIGLTWKRRSKISDS